MTPAQDIDRDFDHVIAMCMHSWSERDVVAALRRLQDKVHEQLAPADLIKTERTPCNSRRTSPSPS